VTSRPASIVPIWVLVIVGVVLVGLLAPAAGYFRWLTIVLAGATILTFIVQLALPTKKGLVLRMMASVGGSVVLVAIATAILGPLSA
jgi:hypothetical protein